MRLLEDTQIGDDWVYVPAGPFLSCGDDGALEARPSARPVLPGFLIRRLPLSLRDYAVVVNGLHSEDPDAAWDCVPSGESAGTVLNRVPTTSFPTWAGTETPGIRTGRPLESPGITPAPAPNGRGASWARRSASPASSNGRRRRAVSMGAHGPGATGSTAR